MAKFPLRKVANNTWKADSTREEEGAKKCQFMSPCTPGASGLNSVPVGLQALKEETRGKHTCDLNRKEERSPVDASVVETTLIFVWGSFLSSRWLGVQVSKHLSLTRSTEMGNSHGD